MIWVFNKNTYKGDGEYIGRGANSPLGNPFTHILAGTKAEFVVKNRKEAIERYEQWLLEQLKSDTPAKQEFDRLVRKYKATRELNLICWCVPYNNCHGYVLKKLIEEACKDVAT